MKKLKEFLAPEYLFSWTVFLATFSWALAVHFADTLNNKPEGYPLRFGIVLISHVSLFSFWWISKKVFLDHLKPNWVPISLFIVIAVGSGLRGLLFQYLLNLFDFSTQIDYLQRAFVSLLNLSLATTIAIMAVANLRAHRSTRMRLLTEANRLEFIKIHSNAAIGTTSSEAAAQIEKDLLLKISQMRKMDLPQLLLHIRSMIDDVLRPLANSLDESTPSWVPPKIDRRSHRIGFYSALRDSAQTSRINYVFVPVFMYVITFPSVLERTSAFTAFVIFPITIFLGGLWCFFVAKIISPLWNSIPAYIFLTILSGAIFGASTLVYSDNFRNPFSLFYSAVGFYPTWSFVISFLKSLFRLNSETNQKLKEFTNEMVWQVAFLSEKSFQNKNRLAHFLHGQVQAKLASTYLQLGLKSNQDPELRDFIDKLLDELEQTIKGIGSSEFAVYNLTQTTRKVAEIWTNIAQVTLVADSEVISRIHEDQVCTSILIELIPELCFNSIKHGRAKSVSVDFNFKSNRVLELIVTNDGLVEDFAPGVGLGSKLLNEVSIFWQRKNESGKTVTRVHLAYRASE